MNYRKLLILISILFLSISCDKDETYEQISFRIIEEGNMSYSDLNKISKQYLIFENNNEWLDFLTEIERVHPSTAEKLKDLDFDFDQYHSGMVIGEFYNYCCSKITIEKVYKENGEVRIDFNESGQGIATALSQAYMILEIEKE